MAARKLQTEIDRTLKKVAEGVEQFEQLYEKMQNSTNQTQKEKMEADLKTQIKKLQRLRDQIKTWQQANEIKDKKALNDGRKAIETQMERFKATEKEMKTKAFSKEGLIAAARLDPAEKAKVEMAAWISSQVDELGRQIEASEAEIEQVQAGTGKKKKGAGASAEKTAGLEQLNERRSWHVGRLEILHRMLENGTLEPDRVGEIKDDITYFVDSNAEDEFEEDEGIYDDFDLDEQEEAFGLKGDDETQDDDDEASAADESSVSAAPAKTPVKETPKRRESDLDAGKKEEKKAAPSITTRKASDAARGGASGAAGPSDPKAVPPANFAAAKQPSSSPTHTTSPTKPTAPAAATLPPIRYAAAAAAAVGSSSAAPPAAPAISPAAPSSAIPSAGPASTAAPTAPSEAAVSPSPASSAPTAPSEPAVTASPAPSHAPSQVTSMSGEDAVSSSGPSAPPGLMRTQSPNVNGSSKPSPSLTHSSLRRQSTAQESPIPENAGAPGSRADGSSSSAQHFGQLASPATQSSAPQAPFAAASLAGTSGAAAAVQPSGGAASAQKPTEARLPSSLADLVTSFESAKMKSLHRDENMPTLHKSLEASFMNVPEPLDSEKPKYYIPKHPFATPGYYPQAPAPIFDNPSIYSKFDEDTLFYIFYYQQGTYHQFLAARELKKQSWRFHKQFLTWFRRHSEPQSITDDYEQGVYVYFDWEGSWAQRKKSDFRFEYRWLED